MGQREAPTGKPELRLLTNEADSIDVVLLLGEHDISSEADVTDTLAFLLESGADVVVDLSEAEFIDSSTIHALEDSRYLALQHGRRVSFQLATRPIVKRVLELTGILTAWPVYGTRAEAIEAVRRPSLRGEHNRPES